MHLPNPDFESSISSLIDREKGFDAVVFPELDFSDELVPLAELSSYLGINPDYYERHMGDESTFIHKESMHQQVSKLYRFMLAESSSESYVAAVKKKLLEQVELCTPGYMDRVQEAIRSLMKATTVEQLLAVFREDLVNLAKAGRADEVHTNQRFMEVANTNGLAIPFVGVADAYSGEVDDAVIRQKLQNIFSWRYAPAAIVENLYKSVFAERGYAGRKDYAPGDELNPKADNYATKPLVVAKTIDFFKESFGSASLIGTPEATHFFDCVEDPDDDEEVIAMLDINHKYVISKLTQYLFDQGFFRAEVLSQKITAPSGVVELRMDPHSSQNTLCVLNPGKDEALFFLDNAHIFREQLNDKVIDELISVVGKNAVLSKEKKDDFVWFLGVQGFDVGSGVLELLAEQRVRDSESLLANLLQVSPEKHGAVLGLVEKRIPDIMEGSTMETLKSIQEFLIESRFMPILDTVKDALPDMVTTIDDFKFLIAGSRSIEKELILELLDDQLPGLIQNVDDLIVVFSLLSKTQCEKLMLDGADRLRSMLGLSSANSFAITLALLKDEQRQIVLDFMHEDLPGIMQGCSIRLLGLLHSELSQYQFGLVFDAIEGQLPNTVTSIRRLKSLLDMVDEDKKERVLAAMEGHWHQLVSSESDLLSVLEVVGASQCQPLFEALRSDLPSMMRWVGAIDLAKVLTCIEDGAIRDEVFQFATRSCLGKRVTNKEELLELLRPLNEAQRIRLFRCIGHDRLVKILQGSEIGALHAYRGEMLKGYIAITTATKCSTMIPCMLKTLLRIQAKKMAYAKHLLKGGKCSLLFGLLHLIDSRTARPKDSSP
jgi:hypothetical protein